MYGSSIDGAPMNTRILTSSAAGVAPLLKAPPGTETDIVLGGLDLQRPSDSISLTGQWLAPPSIMA